MDPYICLYSGRSLGLSFEFVHLNVANTHYKMLKKVKQFYLFTVIFIYRVIFFERFWLNGVLW